VGLITERVTRENESILVDYCTTHGSEHDGSYLPGRDFKLSKEHPSYLLKQDGQVVGAVSLMRTKRFLSVNKGRFAIFHSILNTGETYHHLLNAIQPHLQDLNSVYLFIPEEKSKLAAIFSGLGFEIERFSFVLERKNTRIAEVSFPEGYSIRPLEPSDLDGISQFVNCLNKEFKELAGHTTNSVEDLLTWFEDKSYLEGGLCLLKKDQEPVGTISMMRDLENLDAGEILAFGILKEYRGMDLGRTLLRYGVNFLIEQGLDPLILSVNGDNHGAIRLYESEGFKLTESVVCYALETSIEPT